MWATLLDVVALPATASVIEKISVNRGGMAAPVLRKSAFEMGTNCYPGKITLLLYGVSDRVLDAADGILNLAGILFGFTLRLDFSVAGDLADCFFHSAFCLMRAADYPI